MADFPHLPGLHGIAPVQVMGNLVQVAADLTVLGGNLIQHIANG